MASGEFSPAVVRRAWARDGEACFLCRRPLRWHERGIGWSMHHRRPRGSGGTRRLMTCANGLILCGHATTPGGCHRWVESHRETATLWGLLISLNAVGPEFDPANVRVQRDDGTWWLLTDDGRAIEVEGGNR